MKKYLLAIGLALLQTTFSMARDHSPAQNDGFEKEGYISQENSSKEFADTSDLVGTRNTKQLQADMMQRDDIYNKDDKYDNSRRWGRKRAEDESNSNGIMNGDDCCAPAPKPVCCPKPKPKPKCCKPKCPKPCKPKCPKPCCKPCEPTRKPACTTEGCCEPIRLMQYEKPKCCDDNTMMMDDDANYRDSKNNMMRDSTNTINPRDRNAPRDM